MRLHLSADPDTGHVTSHAGPIKRLQMAQCVRSELTGAQCPMVLYSVASDNAVRCFQPRDMRCTSVIEERDSAAPVNCVLAVDSSTLLLTGHEDGIVKMWNTDTGSHVVLSAGRTSVGTVTGIQYLHRPRNDYVIASTLDGFICVWDVVQALSRSAAPASATKGTQEDAASVMPVRARGTRATADTAAVGNCSSASASVRRVTTEQALCTALNELDNTLAVGASDGSVLLLDNNNWHDVMATMAEHTHAVNAVCWDGLFLLSASDDGTVKVWDSCSRLCLRTLTGIFPAP